MFTLSAVRTALPKALPITTSLAKHTAKKPIPPLQQQTRTYFLEPFLTTTAYKYHPSATDRSTLPIKDYETRCSLGDYLLGRNIDNYRLIDSTFIRNKMPLLAKLEDAYQIRFECYEGPDQYPIGHEISARLFGSGKHKTYQLRAFTLKQLANYSKNTSPDTQEYHQKAILACNAHENNVLKAIYQIHPDHTYTVAGIGTAKNLFNKGIASFGHLAIATHVQECGVLRKNNQYQQYTTLGAEYLSNLPREVPAMITYLGEKLENRITSGQITPVEEPENVFINPMTFGN